MKDEEGFNAQTETYENLVQTGVIDPAKVVRSALQVERDLRKRLDDWRGLLKRQMPFTRQILSAHRVPFERRRSHVGRSAAGLGLDGPGAPRRISVAARRLIFKHDGQIPRRQREGLPSPNLAIR